MRPVAGTMCAPRFAAASSAAIFSGGMFFFSSKNVPSRSKQMSLTDMGTRSLGPEFVGAVLDRLGNVVGPDALRPLQVGDAAGHAEDAVIAACGEVHRVEGGL